MSANRELSLADDFVQHTDCSVFLTGKAGTGKTTFLHDLKKKTSKRMIVTAPTGVAAINAGGVTLHSFFQMPFGPFVPGSESYEHDSQRKFNKEKINIIKSLDLLVIDEISMVRADLLDGVDAVLRRYRASELPFGGVQLLMIGDLHQLSPVVKDVEWQILRDFYDSVYFFSSNALQKCELVSIELLHIYRQSDPRFIDLLNRVRDNRLDPGTLNELNTRYIPDFVPPDDQGYITLGTHNRTVDAINESRLSALPSMTSRFSADVDGDFPEYIYPAPAELELKVGAHVMFMRNDSSREKLFFNGKIGIVTRITKTEIGVKCPGDAAEIVVEPATWDNIRYTIDRETREIVEDKVGKFVQFPLKLAWAITIHKSQGLTFERAIIDASAAFAHGQVYVALSRCRTFEGMVLSAPLSARCVKSDAAVSRFVKQATENPPSGQQLTAAKVRYQQRLLLECFDFARLRSRVNWFAKVLLGNARLITVAGIEDIRGLEGRVATEICDIGENFKRQLRTLFSPATLPESDDVVLERIARASVYFQEKIEALLGENLRAFQVETDNKEIGKRIKDAQNQLNLEVAVKMAAVRSCETGFSPGLYLRAISAAEIDFKPEKAKKAAPARYTAADVGHPELFRAIHEWRSQKASEKNFPPYRILHQSVLIQIAVTLPETAGDLKKLKGIGPRTVEKYGRELLEMVADYRREHEITGVVLPATDTTEKGKGKKEKKIEADTRHVTLGMFQAGLPVAAIAEERGLTPATIEGHLAFFVQAGTLGIDRLVPPEKQQAIASEIARTRGSSLKELKDALGPDYSYGELKMMVALLEGGS